MSEPQVLYDGRDFRGAQGRSSEESFNIIPCIHVYIIYMIYNTFDVCWGGGGFNHKKTQKTQTQNRNRW